MSRRSFIEDLLDGDRVELETVALVELRHKLDPMKTKGVEEALHDIHDHEHTEGSADKDEEADEHEKNVTRLEAGDEGAVIEDFR